VVIFPTMTYVVTRPGGWWEIRESVATPRGPRARTLASFKALTDEVLARARAAAGRPFELADVVRSARRAGAPIERSEPDAHARGLTRALARGERPRSGLRRLLVSGLSDDPAVRRAFDDSIARWIGATPRQRGDALVQLLGLADAIPSKRPGTRCAFPGLSPERLR